MTFKLIGFYQFKPALELSEQDFIYDKAIISVDNRRPDVFQIVPLIVSQYICPLPQGAGLPYLSPKFEDISILSKRKVKNMTPIFVVHEFYFLEGRFLTFRNGQSAVFAVREENADVSEEDSLITAETFPLLSDEPFDVNPLDHADVGCHFRYTIFETFKIRDAVAENFTKALKASRGQTGVHFEIRCNSAEFINFATFIHDYRDRMHVEGSFRSRRVPIVPKNGRPIRSDVIRRDVVYLEISNVKVLFSALGDTYFFHPITVRRNEKVDFPFELPYAVIPPFESNIIFRHDRISNILTVTAPVLIANIQEVLNELERREGLLSQLSDQHLNKDYVDDIDGVLYRCVYLEDDSAHFTAKDSTDGKRGRGISVITAWLYPLPTGWDGSEMCPSVRAEALELIEYCSSPDRGTIDRDAKCIAVDPIKDLDATNGKILHGPDRKALSQEDVGDSSDARPRKKRNQAVKVNYKKSREGTGKGSSQVEKEDGKPGSDEEDVLPRKSRHSLESKYKEKLAEIIKITGSEELYKRMPPCQQFAFNAISSQCLLNSPNFRHSLIEVLIHYKISDIRLCFATLFRIEVHMIDAAAANMNAFRNKSDYINSLVDLLFKTLE